ncbi:hypothetical protein OEZ85_010941 [Tetradesmus obliquus]|uniref:Leucine-binding protein domain-containing protein n=1 Tax=Tetradesmus obliquus TaxID=3088 RepID=A0ABY8TQX9_TETOB|nr:hypothetical protein OEZ85_010941 [Tetradesmus obliquus]
MKSEGFRADTESAISDYPDLISDTTVILAREKVVPDVVDACSDKAAFKAVFGDKMVMPGDVLSINDIGNEPKIEITQCSPGGIYSLLMLDPDMPSPHKPEYKDVLIWMVNNIKKNDFDSGDFTVGYSGPEPGKGQHRYVLLLFQQPSFQSITPPTKRANFQTKQFAKDMGWGDPVAVPVRVLPGAVARNEPYDMAYSTALLLCLVAASAAVAVSETPKTIPDFTINNPGAKTTIKIGCMLPFSGSNAYAAKGVAAREGIKLALTDLAAANKGYNFVLTCVDTQCEADSAKAGAAILKTRGVVGVIGEICSKASLAAKDVLAPILLISPTSTSDKLTIAGDNFFRLSPPDRFQSRVLANLVKASGLKPVGVVVEPNAYGQGLADGFTAAYKKLGGTVKTTIVTTPTNAVQAAQDMAKSGVPKVVIAMNNDTWVAQFLAAGAAIPGFSPELYAGDAQYSPTLPGLVAGFGKTTLLDKLTVSAYNQGTAAFKDRYAKATKEPYAGHAAHAFDAATVLVQGYLADAKGGKPVAIASNASPLKVAFTGVSGDVKFDATGDLIPDNTSYQSVTYKALQPVVGGFLALPSA